MKKFLIVIMVLFLYGCDQVIIPSNTDDPIVDYTNLYKDLTHERLFETDIHKKFVIEFEESEFNKLDQYMVKHYENYGNFKSDDVVLGKLTYEDESGSYLIDHVAIRTRGNTSRDRLIDDEGNLAFNHYKVHFNKPLYLDSNTNAYKGIDKRKIFGVTELNFKGNRNYDSSYITERFSYELFEDFGVLSPKMTHAKLYVKVGSELTYMGVYGVFESIDKDFLSRNFSNNRGDLYKSLWQQFGPATLENNYHNRAIGIKDASKNYFPAYDLKTNKTTSTHKDLIDFIYYLNVHQGAQFEAFIESNFDVDRFLRYLAVGVFLGNPDDYRAMGNNYYLYLDVTSNKWTLIPYDYDHGLGQGWDGRQVFSNYTIGADIYRWGNLNSVLNNRTHHHPLSDKILKIEKYQLQYEAYLAELYESYFLYERFIDLYNTVSGLYEKDAEGGLLSLPFELRGQSYFTDKRADVFSQLNHYKNNPSERP